MAERVPVTVLARLKSKWWNVLRVTHKFEMEFPACRHMDCLLSDVLEQLTTADPSAEWAIKYREDYNRSLWVDDVVLVGETAWVVEPGGWAPISVQASQVEVHGWARFNERRTRRNEYGDWRAWTRAEVARSHAAGRSPAATIGRVGGCLGGSQG
jgi:hypothetical protein